MAAADKNRSITGPKSAGLDLPKRFEEEAAASVRVYQGTMVAIDVGTSGRPARPASANLNYIVLGFADREIDNSSGAQGAKKVPITVQPGWVGNSGGGDAITTAHKGLLCYVVDDQTVALTNNSGARPIAGLILDVSSQYGVLIYPFLPLARAVLGAGSLAAGALSADAQGRAVMATDYFNAATVADKFAADSFTNANLLDLIQDGAFAASDATRALFATGFFNATAVDDKFATGSIGEDRLTANELNGRVMANVADVPVIGGIPVIFPVAVADAATSDIDIVSTHKVRVYDVEVYKTGGAGGAANSVQVKNGANAISDVISTNIADQAVARAATIDDAFNEVAAGGTIRVSRVKAGGNAACQVHILAYRIA